MKRVLTAVVLIPFVLALVLRAPFVVFAVAIAGVSFLSAREFLDLAGHYGAKPFRLPSYVAIVVLFGALIVRGIDSSYVSMETAILVVFAAAVLAPFAYLLVGMARVDLATAYPAAAASVFAIGYTVIPFLLLAQVRRQSRGAFWCLFLLLLVWVGDTCAYYVGRAIGRHKIAPRVSPGKTWEGTLASLAGAIGLGWLILTHGTAISTWLWQHGVVERAQGYMAVNPSLVEMVVLSACINVTAQLGDLLESLLKRGAGVKDSGALLPGHGGMLDRIDALLFAAPVLWYYVTLRVMS